MDQEPIHFDDNDDDNDDDNNDYNNDDYDDNDSDTLCTISTYKKVKKPKPVAVAVDPDIIRMRLFKQINNRPDEHAGIVNNLPYGMDSITNNNISLLLQFTTFMIHPDDICTYCDKDEFINCKYCPCHYSQKCVCDSKNNCIYINSNNSKCECDYENRCYCAGIKKCLQDNSKRCTCEGKNKRILYNHILVTIPRNPVNTKPFDSIYTISVIAIGKESTQETFPTDILNLSPSVCKPVCEFSIWNTVNDYSTPMYDEHVESFLKLYDINTWNYGELVNARVPPNYFSKWANSTPLHKSNGGAGVEMFSTFKGCVSATHYVKYFNDLVEEIVTTKKSTMVTNPNNHKGVKLAMIGKDGEIKLNMENDLKKNPHIGIKKKK